MTQFVEGRTATSWGRIRRVPQAIARPYFRDEVADLFNVREGRSVLAVGAGRSYGDTILNSGGCLVDMTALDRILAFDRDAGVLRAEAGLTIDDALQIIVPHGWFFLTTPGTRCVTLGGAVANDVHGKNHHRVGSFGRSVRKLGLLRSDRGLLEIDRETQPELFFATIGGLGQTGLIVWVEVELSRIASSDLSVERIPFRNVAEFCSLASSSDNDAEHIVAWVDCANPSSVGRGIFQRANWKPDGRLAPHSQKSKATVPFDMPSGLLNNLTVRAFNAFYWRLEQRHRGNIVEHYSKFFYPLDAIGNWNRLYGKRGFYQFQCVVPIAGADAVVSELLRQIVKAREGSFLAVLKTLGPIPSIGYLSFPREGVTLALDFSNRGASTIALLERLENIVIEAGGRLYPAKDGRMSQRMFRAGYDKLERFLPHIDPAFSSDFWRRVSA
jgi:FAD/FMN-containing dehydrogenase